MVIIDTLRISDDGNALILDAHVNDSPYFKDVYIDRVAIDTQDTVQESFDGPSNNCIYNEPVSSNSELQGDYLFDKPVVVVGKDILDYVENNHIVLHYADATTINSRMDIIIRLRCPELDDSYEEDGVMKSPIIKLFSYDQEIATITGKSLGDSVYEFAGYDILVEQAHGVEIRLYKYISVTNTEEVLFLEDYGEDPVDVNGPYNRNHFFMAYDILELSEVESKKQVHLVLTTNDFPEWKGDLTDNMFFVYIETGGNVAPDTPCTLDERHTLGVTFDIGRIYNQMMQYTKELNKTCEIPGNFIDMILKLEALKVSIETEHFVPAIQHFKDLIGTKTNIKSCGCYGRNTI